MGLGEQSLWKPRTFSNMHVCSEPCPQSMPDLSDRLTDDLQVLKA
jgi:hypothetical protein